LAVIAMTDMSEFLQPDAMQEFIAKERARHEAENEETKRLSIEEGRRMGSVVPLFTEQSVAHLEYRGALQMLAWIREGLNEQLDMYERRLLAERYGPGGGGK
jgi:hypothetical protein